MTALPLVRRWRLRHRSHQQLLLWPGHCADGLHDNCPRECSSIPNPCCICACPCHTPTTEET